MANQSPMKPPRSPDPISITTPSVDKINASPMSVMSLHNTNNDENKDENMQFDENMNICVSEREVDYEKNPTKLYQLIERREWAEMLEYISKNPSDSAIFVYRKCSKNGNKLRWRQLPIHAALVFRGKIAIIAALIKSYPQALLKRDDQGMIPLHLAFRYKSSEAIINLIMQAYPKSILMKDNKGRIPIELANKNSFDQKKDKNINSNLTLRTYVSYYYSLVKSELTAKVHNEQANNNEREIQDINNRFKNLEEINLKCENLLIDASKKIQGSEATIMSLEKDNESKDSQMKFMSEEIEDLKKQLIQERTERITVEANKTLELEMSGVKHRNALETQKELYEKSIAQLKEQLQQLENVNKQNESDLKQRSTEVSAMTDASEVLLSKVKELENDLANQKTRYFTLQGKIDSQHDREEKLMGRVCELTDNLLKRSSEKKALMKKHSEEMHKLMKENIALQLRCR